MWQRITLIISVTIMVIGGGSFPAFCAEPAAGSGKQGGVGALLELLQTKGIITGEEAATIGSRLNEQVMPGDDVSVLIGQLREKWIAGERSGEDFDELYNEVRDADLIIERMRVMGILSGEEAEQLSETYHKRYLAGAISEVVGNREGHYLKTVADSAAGDVKQSVQDQVTEGVNKVTKSIASSEWAQRIKLGGDLRFRYESIFFDDSNADFYRNDKPEPLNSHINRQRVRLRARLNVTAKVNDQTDAVIGLATGNTTDPVSTNATLGDFFNKKTFVLDQAYFRIRPIPELAVLGGRFPNPWFYSDLVWDPDVNFDGLAVTWTPRVTETLSGFVTAGAFPLQEIEFSQRDKWLLAGQVGVEYKPSEELSAKFGVAFYDFEHTEGIMNEPGSSTNDWTMPQFQQKGNTRMFIDQTGLYKLALAGKYRELALTGMLDIGFWNPVHVVLLADYVNNIGFDYSEVLQKPLWDWNSDLTTKQTEGYQFGVTVGYPKVQNLGDWQSYLFYKHLEADAVIDAFAESDFHAGGTNAEGWILGGEIGVAKNLSLSAKWLTTNEIVGPKFAVDTFQANVNVRF
ncbi:putative porin [Geotalea uraniireducens]|uniref:Uncharacterized protein n=1 Tax=Geotalea uraniireducens (strain Rf4) TaxID=351605 RepID=A5G4R5_GEOUR|nr:putative porin [Geotalea uraniireducens]ABQ26783.1 hypothetical protein Gura_2606 [Geotalea uraniireducens Rf4]